MKAASPKTPFRRVEECFTVLAYLYDERSILGTRLQRVLAILRVLAEAAAVEHGRVAQLGTVAATQQTPRQLAGIHHGGHLWVRV